MERLPSNLFGRGPTGLGTMALGAHVSLSHGVAAGR